MEYILPYSVRSTQPDSGAFASDDGAMETDLKRVLAANVRALIVHQTGELIGKEKTGVSRLTARGIAQGNAQRILDGKTSVGVDLLADVAALFGVAPWQLLVPDLRADSPPGLTEDSTAWPLPMVDRLAYKSLTLEQRAFVQGVMQAAVSGLQGGEAKRRAA